jgi:hypothetical protein
LYKIIKKSQKTIIFIIIIIKYNTATASSIIIPPLPIALSSRPLGMGGAFVGVADDENAIFSNPAGVGFIDPRNKTKDFVKSASFPGLSVASNSYTYNLINHYFNPFTHPKNIIDLSVQNINKSDIIFSRFSFFPNIVFDFAQFGILVDSHLSGYTTKLNSPQTSAFSTTTYDREFSIVRRDQIGLIGGFSLPIFEHFIIGFGARYLQRKTIINTIEADNNGTINESYQNIENNANYTKGTAFDLGIIVPFQHFLRSKIGVSLLDIGDTIYKSAKSLSKDEIEKMNIKAGLSINPSISKNIGATVSIEQERINDSRLNFRNKIRAGCELSFGSFNGSNAPFSVRIGYGMQSVSAGVSVNLFFADIDFSTYREQVATADGFITDRRYVAKISVSLVE